MLELYSKLKTIVQYPDKIVNWRILCKSMTGYANSDLADSYETHLKGFPRGEAVTNIGL